MMDMWLFRTLRTLSLLVYWNVPTAFLFHNCLKCHSRLLTILKLSQTFLSPSLFYLMSLLDLKCWFNICWSHSTLQSLSDWDLFNTWIQHTFDLVGFKFLKTGVPVDADVINNQQTVTCVILNVFGRVSKTMTKNQLGEERGFHLTTYSQSIHQPRKSAQGSGAGTEAEAPKKNCLVACSSRVAQPVLLWLSKPPTQR